MHSSMYLHSCLNQENTILEKNPRGREKMASKKSIENLTIMGFKSIRELTVFSLKNLNVMIGANGAGKSNFIEYFRMLQEMIEGRLQRWTRRQGGADRILSFGVKQTRAFRSEIAFDEDAYSFILEPAINGGFSFVDECVFTPHVDDPETGYLGSLGSGHGEAKLKERHQSCYHSISSWKVFHFHDTSDTAGVKRLGALHDNDYLRPDASNLAAFLHRMSVQCPDVYQQILKTIQLCIPFFDDFVLKPKALPTGEEQIRLLWRQKESDYPLWPSQLSDGSIRFICLATALLQPNPPSTMIIDEPELGLHPYAITLMGSLLRSASKRMQIIVSTQSVSLVNEFSVDDLIIVERENGSTVFTRYDQRNFKNWLEEYSAGELWEKNILGGRPPK